MRFVVLFFAGDESNKVDRVTGPHASLDDAIAAGKRGVGGILAPRLERDEYGRFHEDGDVHFQVVELEG